MSNSVSSIVSNFLLTLPADFSDYEWEVTAKGCFSKARLVASEKSYRVSFYDPIRLGQEIQYELERIGSFFEPNIIVVKSVTRSEMEKATLNLVTTGQIAMLMPEKTAGAI